MEATLQATAQQLEAKAQLDADRARDRSAKSNRVAPPAAPPGNDLKGEAVRTGLDQAVVGAGLTGVGLPMSWLIINARVLGGIFKNTRLGVIRFTAKNVFEMLPNAKKMRPFTFTPVTGAITAGITNAIIGLALLLVFMTVFIPAYLLSNKLEAIRIFGSAIIDLYF